MKFIDNDAEHNQVLYALGILDDEEDWLLFQKMQREQDNDIDTDAYLKYMNLKKREVPKRN